MYLNVYIFRRYNKLSLRLPSNNKLNRDGPSNVSSNNLLNNITNSRNTISSPNRFNSPQECQCA